MNKRLVIKASDFSSKSAQYVTLGLDGFCHYKHYKPLIMDVMVETKPKSILETGFFLGSSSFVFLESSDANVLSVDPAPPAAGLVNAQSLKVTFGARFDLLIKSSADIATDIAGRQFDLMFIDGDHSAEGFSRDMDTAISHGIPYVLIDDFNGVVRDTYNSSYASRSTVIREYQIEGSGNEIDDLLIRLI